MADLRIDKLIAAGSTRIELRTPFKNVQLYATPYKDIVTGEYKGISNHDELEIKKSKVPFATPEDTFLLTHGTVLETSNPRHMQILGWLLETPEIALSEEDVMNRTSLAKFYIYDPDREARVKVARIQLKLKAQNLVSEDTETGLSYRLRVLENPMEGATRTRMQAAMFQEVEKNPSRIIELYNEEKFDLFVLLYRALDRGIIEYKAPIYSYGTKFLGNSKEIVVEFLSSPLNKNVLELIKKQLEDESIELDETNTEGLTDGGDGKDLVTSGLIPSSLM